MTVATFAAAQLLRVLPRERITRAVGRLVDLPLAEAVSRKVVGVYARAYDVDLDEARTRGAYPSFDAFFTRELRDGARPQCQEPAALVSPADGRVEAAGPVDEKGALTIKGKPYQVDDLVGDWDDARRFEGGQFAVIYLSPRDYHRVHCPVEAKFTEVRSMPGDLYPVNSIGERHIPWLFARNRRVAMAFDTKEQGRVVVVMVSAMIVGRISVTGIEGSDAPFGRTEFDEPRTMQRGDEIGIFHLGSTAVVFVEPNRFEPLNASQTGQSVRMGEMLAGAR